MTTGALVTGLLALAWAAYWQLSERAEKASEYRTRSETARARLMEKITTALAECLAPEFRRPSIVTFDDALRPRTNPTQLPSAPEMSVILEEFTSENAAFLADYVLVRQLCEKLIRSLRRLRRFGLMGGGGLLLVAMAIQVLASSQVVPEKWLSVSSAGIVAVAVLAAIALKSGQDALADMFEDACSRPTNDR